MQWGEMDIQKKSKTLTITGKGYAKITGFYDKSLSSYEWPCSEDSVLPVFTKIKFGEGITQVDYRYFAMEGIKQISLPKSFKRLSMQALFVSMELMKAGVQP